MKTIGVNIMVPLFLIFTILWPVCPSMDAAEPASQPWWDHFPTIVQANRPDLAKGAHATAALCGAADDPAWGIFAQRLRHATHPGIIDAMHARGIKALTWMECFGTTHCYIVQLKKDAQGAWIRHPSEPALTRVYKNAWNWRSFDGTGQVRWLGAHNYFDPEDFLGAYTRNHPRYGCPPMTYPDGTPALGFLKSPAEPWTHRVFHAGCARDVMGRPFFENAELNASTPDKSKGDADAAALELSDVPDPGYSPEAWGRLRREKIGALQTVRFDIGKDALCPIWFDYQRASIRQALDLGIDGVWLDNFSPWDSLNAWPVRKAFGAWSVAGFEKWCAENHAPAERQAMGLSKEAASDIRQYLQKRCRNFGGHPGNLRDPAWRDRRWLDDPVWMAYQIYKRQTGTQALSRFYSIIKEEAAAAGKPDFLVMGNDIPMFSLGWPRGDLDMVSTELNWNWSLTGGARGLMPPPLGSYVPVYRLARPHAKSRFVNVWYYVPEDQLGKPNIARVLYYQGLATHALPMPHYPHRRNAGTPKVDADFFGFVRKAAPVFAGRKPVADVGLFYSSSSQIASMTPAGFASFNNQVHIFSFWGWGTALTWLHIPWRAVPEWRLTQKNLGTLNTLIIPSAEVISQENMAALTSWCKSGGQLIMAGNCGSRLGEKHLFKPMDPAGRVAGRVRMTIVEKDPGPAFYKADKNRPELLSSFRALLENRPGQPDGFALTAEDTPWHTGLSLFRVGNRLFVDVNNTQVDIKQDKITPLARVQFTVSLPTALREQDLALKVLSPSPKTTGRLDRLDAGRVQISLHNIDVYASVCLTFKGPRKEAMPRIGVRHGRFFNRATGETFHPRGFNYIRLDPERGWHSTFGPGWYDAQRAGAMFRDLAANGYNVVRVFIDFMPKRGTVADRQAQTLSKAYMDNVLDFLKRARACGIYVIPTLVHFPDAPRYRALTGPPPKQAAGQNLKYLHPGAVRAKALYMADFARAIKAHDPALLTTVLAFELENETHFIADVPPFSLTQGMFQLYSGKQYRLDDPAGKQQLADDAVALWADQCRNAVRQVDPEALVTANVFTFRAVGRSGPARLDRDKTHDRRFPARPLALAASTVDYIDIHFYPMDETTLPRDLRSIEFEALKARLKATGQPLIMGEFGAFKHAYKTLGQAAGAMTGHWTNIQEKGFQGFIYWTYDCDEQVRLWNGKSGSGQIFKALAPGQ